MVCDIIKYCLKKLVFLILLVGVLTSFQEEEKDPINEKYFRIECIVNEGGAEVKFNEKQSLKRYKQVAFSLCVLSVKEVLVVKRVKKVIEYCQQLHYC